LLLGNHRLEAPIGRGGMGRVWRARSAGGGPDVAVKVLAAADHLRATLQAEVAAMARLDHPHICAVYDQGVVSEAEAAASEGLLVAGAPYLVMELARGALDREPAPGDFAALRRVLLSLLDALAHAHARGLVHRDVKPANVLVAPDGSLRLADFGIARALGAGLGDGRSVHGSPPYMPPEQIGGHARDQGPWTDLYALGCVAWELTTGQPPFGGPVHHVLQAHLNREPPALIPRFPVPDGFEEWLHGLLEKDPGARVGHAAAAAAQLAALLEPDATGGASTSLSPSESTSSTLSLTLGTLAPITETEELPASPTFRPGPRRPLPALPVPSESPRPRPRRDGARIGLGLFGVRTVPLIGREAEQERLWAALRRAWAERRPVPVAISGPAGVGKSVLARWLAEQAEELGVATALFAGHDLPPGPADGIVGAVARAFAVEGLPAAAAADRIERRMAGRLDRRDAEILAAAVAGPNRPSTEAFHATVGRWLEVASADRPVVLWLDDVQWGGDALRLATRLLDAPIPVVFVITARAEALPERPVEADMLARIAAHATTTNLDLGPLDGAAMARLLQALAPLDPVLAARIRRHAAGQPLYAVELLSDWIRRGALEPGPSGWALAGHPPLPEDLRALWISRLDAIVTAADSPALEVAAALGLTVEVAEWRAAAGLDPAQASELLARLVLADLVRARDGSFVFVHGLLRDALLQRARDAGRLEAHHAAIAEALDGRGTSRGRVGRHLMRAGLWERSVELLLRGAEIERRAGALFEAEELLRERDAALDALGAGPNDARRLEGLVQLAWIMGLRGQEEAWNGMASDLLARAESVGEARSAGDAAWLLGDAARSRGDLQGAWDMFSRANAWMQRAGSASGRSDCERALGAVANDFGRQEEARVHCDAAVELAIEAGDGSAEGSSRLVRAIVAMSRQDLDSAARDVAEAAENYRSAGYDLGRAHAVKVGADIELRRGNLDAARAGLEAALDQFARAGYRFTDVTRLQLATVENLSGNPVRALRLLSELRPRLRAQGHNTALFTADASAAEANAMLGDLAALDADVADMYALPNVQGVDPDLQETLERVADRLVAMGEPQRAARVRALRLPTDLRPSSEAP
jgi:serine/threonine protein kinase